MLADWNRARRGDQPSLGSQALVLSTSPAFSCFISKTALLGSHLISPPYTQGGELSCPGSTTQLVNGGAWGFSEWATLVLVPERG